MNVVKCSQCGALYLDTDYHCPSCGSQQRENVNARDAGPMETIEALLSYQPGKELESNPDEADRKRRAEFDHLNSDSVDPWIAGLYAADPFRRAECAFRLGERRDGSAVEALIAALRLEGDLFTRAALCQAIGRMGDERALPVLRETLRALRDDPITALVLIGWSESGIQNVLPESFKDLPTYFGSLYDDEQRLIKADSDWKRQALTAFLAMDRREYIFQSVLFSMAQLGQWEDLGEITPFLTWRWEDKAIIEAHKGAADALTMLLKRLSADGDRLEELAQLERSVSASRKHTLKEGWNVLEYTNRTFAAIFKKRHAVRALLRRRFPTWHDRMWDWVKEVFDNLRPRML